MRVPAPEPRVARFGQMAYGMFIHWGLYSQLGRCVWGVHPRHTPIEEYRKLTEAFTAPGYRPRDIAARARRAGMEYVTLTTRQHDGFSLYDTRGLCDYDAPHSAAARDLIAEFVEGCRAEGMDPFLYHTTYDWFQPSFTRDFDAYLGYLHKSVELLCTRYGEIGGFWFDGNWSRPDADWKEDRLYGMIRRLQPEAIIISNTGVDSLGALGHPGIDRVTFEQARPTPRDRTGASKYVAAEMCQSMNVHWAVAPRDLNYLSPKDVIENVCACRRAGANYLLNVGPTPEGAIPDYEAAALARAGEWVAMHADPIHMGRPCGVVGDGPDFGLEANGELYLYVHSLGVRPGQLVGDGPTGPGARPFHGVQREVTAVRWVDNDEALEADLTDDGALTVNATGFPPGTNTVVRVAEVR